MVITQQLVAVIMWDAVNTWHLVMVIAQPSRDVICGTTGCGWLPCYMHEWTDSCVSINKKICPILKCPILKVTVLKFDYNIDLRVSEVAASATALPPLCKSSKLRLSTRGYYAKINHLFCLS